MILCKPVGLKNNTAKLNVLNVKQLTQYTENVRGTTLCWILPPSVYMGEVLSLTGRVPMPQLFPFMDMGELPDAGGRVPGANPCTVYTNISDMLLLSTSCWSSFILFVVVKV